MERKRQEMKRTKDRGRPEMERGHKRHTLPNVAAPRTAEQQENQRE
jgi:hypothetical protein